MDSDGPMDSGGPIVAHRGPMGPLGPVGPSWWAHPLPVLAHFHVLFTATRTDFPWANPLPVLANFHLLFTRFC